VSGLRSWDTSSR